MRVADVTLAGGSVIEFMDTTGLNTTPHSLACKEVADPTIPLTPSLRDLFAGGENTGRVAAKEVDN